MRGSVSLPGSISESKPLLMFHSSVSLLCIHRLLLCRVFLHLTLPESQKVADKKLLRRSLHLYFHLVQEKEEEEEEEKSGNL